jgi:hypothetical protein
MYSPLTALVVIRNESTIEFADSLGSECQIDWTPGKFTFQKSKELVIHQLEEPLYFQVPLPV